MPIAVQIDPLEASQEILCDFFKSISSKRQNCIVFNGYVTDTEVVKPWIELHQSIWWLRLQIYV